MPLLDVRHLTTRFYTRNGIVRAVEDLSFSLEKGETLGIVGESGSGKSVTCYSLLGLIPQPPGRIESGEAIFDGTDLLSAGRKTVEGIRGKRISMIFQDPMTSLNPYLRVSTQLIEPLLIHEKISKKEAIKLGIEALEAVGLSEASKRIHFYPHEFSGGMRQRVMIAMAMITHPDLLIADEPTTALDVTVQAQILELIRDGKKRTTAPSSSLPMTSGWSRAPATGSSSCMPDRWSNMARRTIFSVQSATPLHGRAATFDSVARGEGETALYHPRTAAGSLPSRSREMPLRCAKACAAAGAGRMRNHRSNRSPRPIGCARAMSNCPPLEEVLDAR
jgi:ABC-type dipeptide/oligopeptide/nickel transport system ATPase subunit